MAMVWHPRLVYTLHWPSPDKTPFLNASMVWDWMVASESLF